MSSGVSVSVSPRACEINRETTESNDSRGYSRNSFKSSLVSVVTAIVVSFVIPHATPRSRTPVLLRGQFADLLLND